MAVSYTHLDVYKRQVNGCTASDQVVVTQNITAPNVNAGLDKILTCDSTSISLNGSSSTAGVTYAWSTGATTAATTVSATGTYTLTVRNPVNGCTASDQVVVTQNITAPNGNEGSDIVMIFEIPKKSLNRRSRQVGATYQLGTGEHIAHCMESAMGP